MSSPDYTIGPAQAYERYLVPAFFGQWADDLVARAALRSGERVLDVACGTGVVTRRALTPVSPGGAVTGLDISPGMLAAARAVASDLDITWQEASALAMPFADATFDVVLCHQGLQFMPDRVAALGEMRRVLVPGGRLLLGCWRSTRDSPGFRALEQALARQIGTEIALSPFALDEVAELRRLLTAAGWHDIVVTSAVKMTRFPSAEDFVRSIFAGVPSMLGPLASQGETAVAAISSDVAEALPAYLDDHGLAFPLAANIATARV